MIMNGKIITSVICVATVLLSYARGNQAENDYQPLVQGEKWLDIAANR